MRRSKSQYQQKHLLPTPKLLLLGHTGSVSRHKQIELRGPKTENLDMILFVEFKIAIYKNLRGTTVINKSLKSDDKKAIGDSCQPDSVPGMQYECVFQGLRWQPG